jgi:hypothetical protein
MVFKFYYMHSRLYSCSYLFHSKYPFIFIYNSKALSETSFKCKSLSLLKQRSRILIRFRFHRFFKLSGRAEKTFISILINKTYIYQVKILRTAINNYLLLRKQIPYEAMEVKLPKSLFGRILLRWICFYATPSHGFN